MELWWWLFGSLEVEVVVALHSSGGGERWGRKDNAMRESSEET